MTMVVPPGGYSPPLEPKGSWAFGFSGGIHYSDFPGRPDWKERAEPGVYKFAIARHSGDTTSCNWFKIAWRAFREY